MTWEPPGADPMEIHVAEAEAYLDMNEADIRAAAARRGMTVADFRLWRQERIAAYRSVDPHNLTPDQHQRLFRGLNP
jgi:hypothetical protein